MGWLWMCLRGDKATHKLRVKGRGRVSSDLHALKLQSHPLELVRNTPRIEDFLQPKIPGIQSTVTSANSLQKDVGEKSRADSQSPVDELKEELAVLKQRLAAEAEEAEKLREEVSYLRSSGVDALEDRGKSLEREKLIADGRNCGEDWNPYWGYDTETKSQSDKAQGEDPAVPSTRKSFSELLLEGYSSDETPSGSKGSLALAATAAAVERIGRNPYGALGLKPRDNLSTYSTKGSQMHNYGVSSITDRTLSNARERGPKTADGCVSLVNLLIHENESISQQQQQMLLDISKPSSGGKSWYSGVLYSQQRKYETEDVKRPFVTMSTMDGGEALDIEWIEMRSASNMSNPSTYIEIAKEDASSPRTSGFLLNVEAESLAKNLERAGKRRMKRSGGQEPYEKRPRSPQSPHSRPFLAGLNDSLLAEHKEAEMASAVAASKEGSLELHSADRLVPENLPKVSISSPRMSISSLFRPSKKRSMASKSHAFRKPLSSVPEALTLDDGFWSSHRNKNDPEISKQLSSNGRLTLTDGAEKPIEYGSLNGISSNTRASEENENYTTKHKLSEAPQSGLVIPSFSFQHIDLTTTTSYDKENQEHERLPPISCSNASYVAMPRPSRRRHSSSRGRSHASTKWTVSENSIDLHPVKDRSWTQEKFGSNLCQKASQIPEAGIHEASGTGPTTQFHDALDSHGVEVQEATGPRYQSSNPENGGKSVSWHDASDDKMATADVVSEQQQQQGCAGSEQTKPLQSPTAEQDGRGKTMGVKDPENKNNGLCMSNQVQFWDSLQNAVASKESASSTITQPEDSRAQSGTPDDDTNRCEGSCQIDISTGAHSAGRTDGEAVCSTPDEVPSASVRALEDTDTSQRADAASLPSRDILPSREADVDSLEHQVSFNEASSQQRIGDPVQWHIPSRYPQVAPEIFISPNGTKRELTFTRLLDIKPEDRPIFGSVAGHWEAAWSSKRQTWDGKGIPNSTNKYKEDQKVSWHATPFEERIERALATQTDGSPMYQNVGA